MSKRLIGGIVVAAAAAVAGPMTTPASACVATLDFIPAPDAVCAPKCPSPTRPYAAVYVDGHWVMVCR